MKFLNLIYSFIFILSTFSTLAQDDKLWTKPGVYTIGAPGIDLLMTIDTQTRSLIWAKPLAGRDAKKQQWLIADHPKPSVSSTNINITHITAELYSFGRFTMGFTAENINDTNNTLTIKSGDPIIDEDNVNYGYDQFQRRKVRDEFGNIPDLGNNALLIRLPDNRRFKYGVTPYAEGEPVQFDNGGFDELEFTYVREELGNVNNQQPPVTLDVSEYLNINDKIDFVLLGDDIPEHLTYSLETQPKHGQAILNGGTVTYTPNPDFTGEDVFTYKATRNEKESNISTITLSVVPVRNISFNIDTNEIAEHESAIITATLDGPAGVEVTVDFNNFSGTVTEDDFNFRSFPLSLSDLPIKNLKIRKGETTASIKVQAVRDYIFEATESLTIASPMVEGANLQNPEDFTINILDVTTNITRIDDMFEGFSNADFAWGDYDLDGDMDVAIIGDKGSGLETILYRNDEINGEHIFVDSSQDFESLGIGTVKWVDINKDGLLDLFVSGLGQSGPKSQLYKNTTDIDNGVDFELDSNYNFPTLFQTSVDFGDLDNDGDVDYAINGTNSEGQKVAFYGFQDTTGQFDIFEANFNTFDEGTIKIFDIDDDGDNDLISSNQTIINNYFNNTNNPLKPNTNFEEIAYFKRSSTNLLSYLTIGDSGDPSTDSNIQNLRIPGYVNGGFTIADFNNDGLEDIFISGALVSGDNPSRDETGSVLYQNTGDTYEASSKFTFEPLTNASVEWVDFDNDGDLDLFTSGFAPGLGQKTYLYEVEVTNIKNIAPNKIEILNYKDLKNGNIQLSWETPKDDFNAIMGYNLRLGTTPGGSELSYLLSDKQTGQLLVNQPPSIFTNNFSIQLDPGKYYWSVQAVDNGFKGGEFSNEQSFTLTYDWKILNQRGIIDKSITPVDNPILEFMDLDNDGDYDLVYGKSPGIPKIYSYKENILKENDLSLLPVSGLVAEDIDLDGKFDLIGPSGTEINVVFFPNKKKDIFNRISKKIFKTEPLYNRKQIIADLNNDGSVNIINIGLDNENNLLANFKMYSTSFNSETSSYTTEDLSDNFNAISKMYVPFFDIGDFDNDQDLDIVISGDLVFGDNITKVFENVTEPGSQNISFQEHTEANLPGVRDGSSSFIDFDSDGDLDILLSGHDDLGNRVFSIYENPEQGDWVKVDTNLPKISDTELEFGDFNGDGYSDLLISGTNSNEEKITKLFEYSENQGFIESDYDLSEFIDAKFAFGDLDGDNDLDFIIAGTSSITNQPIIRTYLNYRAESYALINNASKRTFKKSSKVTFTTNLFNLPPSVPSVKGIDFVGKNGKGKSIIKLSWTKSNDDHTPESSISYALKIGTLPGVGDVMSSGALESGYRKKAGKGNVEMNNSWSIALDPGVYYASIQAIDASFVGSEFSNEVMFRVNTDNTLSIDDSFESLISVSPNPTNSLIHISTSNDDKIKDLKLFNLLGKSYSCKTDGRTFFDMSNLSDGVYMLELTFENGNKIIKKIIKN